MKISWRGLCILPLLFVSVNCHWFPFFDQFGNPANNDLVKGGGEAGYGPNYLNAHIDAFHNGGPFGVDQTNYNDQTNSDSDDQTNYQTDSDSDNQANNDQTNSNGEDQKNSDGDTQVLNVEQPAYKVEPDESADLKKKGKHDENALNAKTKYKGKWELFTKNSGVSAMHLILLPKTDQALMFDATVWKISKLKLPGPPCRHIEGTNEEDCFAHSVLMNIETAEIRPLRLQYDTWCSSGALDVNGRLVSTGGYNNGSDTVRIIDICPTCEWQEYPGALGNGRWYATQVTLGDGRFMVFGGRNFPTYEFVPAEGQKNGKNQVIPFKLLAETNDPVENNLYPFVYLSTDGNLFVFANNRSILLNPNNNQVVHEFPVLPGGARNYPASGCSVLLPIRLQPNEQRKLIPAEVLVCGGASHEAFILSDLKRPKTFLPASKDCARLDISKRNGKWKIHSMPSARVLGDAVLLPTGDVLLINGAQSGSAGWDDARDPNFTPVLYRLRGGKGSGAKFTELKPSQIARMYHSSSALLPDGKILIAGSNTNPGYLDKALFPTEVRVEKFSPHYLDPKMDHFRVEIDPEQSTKQVSYGQNLEVQFRSAEALDETKLQVSIFYPAFTTHGISMNQRLVQLGTIQVIKDVAPGTHKIVLQAPLNGNIAPPGYYMLFVNYNAVPCRRAIWVQLLP